MVTRVPWAEARTRGPQGLGQLQRVMTQPNVDLTMWHDVGAADDPLLVARLIDAVTTLNPWVGHPYRFAAVWLTDSLESVQAANRILTRGVSYSPTDWRNRHYLGFNHFFYLGRNTEAAEILAAGFASQRPGY